MCLPDGCVSLTFSLTDTNFWQAHGDMLIGTLDVSQSANQFVQLTVQLPPWEIWQVTELHTVNMHNVVY